MRALKFNEFSAYANWCADILQAAQLQDVWSENESLVLEFYKFRSFWLLFDLNPQRPGFVFLQQRPPLKKKSTKPVGLFLHSHGVNKRLQQLTAVEDLGRVLRLRLHSLVETDHSYCQMEISLAPQNANVVVTTPVKSLIKQISWAPVREMHKIPHPEPALDFFDGEAWERLWWEEQSPKKELAAAPSNSPAEPPPNKALNKKKHIFSNLSEQMQKLSNRTEQLQLKEYADRIASHLPIPSELETFKKFSIGEAFDRIKQLDRKIVGIAERLSQLQREIEKLESGEVPAPRANPSRASQKMKDIGASGRRLDLGDKLEAVIGKSAKDNLAILREARSWDYWLHMKDYPGAHAIVFREKNQSVSNEKFHQVAEWLRRESKATRGFPEGSKYEVLVVECRFVKPIKGDKLGRVNFQNPQVFLFASKP